MVNVVGTLAFATMALLVAVPFSVIFSVVSFDNILKEPSAVPNTEAGRVMVLFFVIAAPIIAVTVGQHFGKIIGTFLGMAVPKLKALFALAVVGGFYCLWANGFVDSEIIRPILSDLESITLGEGMKYTWPVGAIGVYALVMEVVKNYATTLRGNAGEKTFTEFALGVVIGIVLGIGGMPCSTGRAP